MSDVPRKIYEVAGGDLNLWADPCGAIFLRMKNQASDPVELNPHEALELSEILGYLAKETDEDFAH